MRKVLQYLFGIVVFFGWSMATWANCAVQETAVFYVNGVDGTRLRTEKSSTELGRKLLAHPDIDAECIRIASAYNFSATLVPDLIEAAVQKTSELEIGMPTFWELFFRSTSLDVLWFDDLMRSAYTGIGLTGVVIQAQLESHLERYRKELAEGRRVVVVSHSQGNLYANEAYRALSSEGWNDMHIVAVATPSDEVADGGPYVTVEEDGAAKLFPFALPANGANDEPCPGFWYCHGFLEWYLFGTNSSDAIIGGITGLLPDPVDPCAVKGVVRKPDWSGETVANAGIVLESGTYPFAPIAEYRADGEGRYCIPRSDLGDGTYSLEAVLGDSSIGWTMFRVWGESTRAIDFPIAVPM
jgi:hypothetical protein